MVAVVSAVSSFFTLIAAIIGAVKAWRGFLREQREVREQAKKARQEWQDTITSSMRKLYDSQQAFGHDRIVAECNRHLRNNYITTVDLDNMMHLMKAYEGVGGNGTAHLLWEKVKQLPIDDSKEPDAIRGQYTEDVRADIKKFLEVKTA